MDNNQKITKKPFINRLREKKGYREKEAIDIYNIVIETLIDEILKGNEIKILGFGNFKLKIHKGQKVRFSNEDKKLDDYLTLKFDPSSVLIKKLRNNQALFQKIKKRDKVIETQSDYDDSLPP